MFYINQYDGIFKAFAALKGTSEVSNAGWFMMKLVVPKVDAWKVKLGVHYMVPTLFMYVFVGRLCKG